jgi:DNA-binding transcriptional regulator LsrR (DeoR family)
VADLAAVPQVIAIAGGSEKAAAVRAAVLSGCINTLIVDAAAADAIVTEARAGS